MRILLCGATGFIGRHLAARLRQAGHEVVPASRQPLPGGVAMNYMTDTTPEVWLPRLQGIDAVVNAVGILIESSDATYGPLHHQGPAALFDACVLAGVKRVVQVSALGAETASTPYFATKKAAEDHLQQLPLAWQIVRPSVVYGPDGHAARLFHLLAALPVISLPAGGRQAMQPVHVDDLADLVLQLLNPEVPAEQVVEAVGAQKVLYRDMLAAYRRGMGWSSAIGIPVPGFVIDLTVKLLDFVPGVVLNSDTWRMLQQGSVGGEHAVTTMTQLLGREPLGVDQFITARNGPALRKETLARLTKVLIPAALVVAGCAALLAGLLK
ncbi:MAG TPA: NAD-dependent epimerase/dehydratase family protein [Rhodocyclaceae bacterium]